MAPGSKERNPTSHPSSVEINAPAGNLAALKAAVDAGADSVYCGFAGPTNLRNLPGLNFTVRQMAEGIAYARRRGARVFITVNAYPQRRELEAAYRAADRAAAIRPDAVMVSDLSLLQYFATRHPEVPIHLSVQASACNRLTIAFYRRHFGIRRVTLPRALSLEEIAALTPQVGMEVEVFAFGFLSSPAEGTCRLSSFITGEAINTYGACPDPRFLRFETRQEPTAGEPCERLRVLLCGVALNAYSDGEPMAYPTPCKGRYRNSTLSSEGYAIQAPRSLDVRPILPRLLATGIRALKIEGRQRSAQYVARVTSALRRAVDAALSGLPEAQPDDLAEFHEGDGASAGCYVEKEA